jgi:oligopeptide transport system permease protein
VLRLIVWRLVQLPVILAVVFFVTFAAVWVLPGDPLSNDEGRRPPAAVQAAIQRQYNLDSPWSFVTGYVRGLVLGSERYPAPDFGPSLVYRDVRVADLIAEGLPVSVMVGALALVVALCLGTLAGVTGALRPGSWLDSGSLMVALLGVSLPSFVTGSVLLVVFAGLLGWLPVGGWGDWRHLILPAVTLGIAPAAYIARLVRLGLADVMTSDFIRTARAKGLSHRRALFGHAMKVAYLPVLSFLGPAAAGAMTGSFVVEQVFNLPGLGEHFVAGVLNKDQFLILGVVLVYATMLVGFNLVVDVAYAWLDPRIEVQG